MHEHETIRQLLSELPISQSGLGRHRCAGCAYEKGFQDGVAKKEVINFRMILSALPESQAQPQRHKDAQLAYLLGYVDGLKKVLAGTQDSANRD